jgi:hypothetical protein
MLGSLYKYIAGIFIYGSEDSFRKKKRKEKKRGERHRLNLENKELKLSSVVVTIIFNMLTNCLEKKTIL